MKLEGWVLDTYIEKNEAVLWIKTREGSAVKVTDVYRPDFYVLPSSKANLDELLGLIGNHPNVHLALPERKYVSVNHENKKEVIHIWVNSTADFKAVIKILKDNADLFNTDLLHIQRYLFNRNITPTSKVEVLLSDNNRLEKITVLDDSKEIEPPPFKPLLFNVEIKSQSLVPNVGCDPVKKIIVSLENGKAIESEGNEIEILKQFEELVKDLDPDFLVAPEAGTLVLPYLLNRARRLKLSLQLGRELADLLELNRPVPFAIRGRVYLDYFTYEELGLVGLVERARFSILPPGLAARWSAGRTIDSRQCYEALKRDILVPSSNGYFRWIRTVGEIALRDRGGLILSPKIGLHENVAELDFESMFPTIITKFNISYETVTPHHIIKDREGFLPQITRTFLERRAYFKHLKKQFSKDDPRWKWCEQRQLALKAILVYIFGYSGCAWNRFNNVACFEEICRIARDSLVKTMNVALRRGFEVVYADTDSIFVKKPEATVKDYRQLCEEITKETGLSIALDHHYKFLALLPLEADPNLEASKRYYGKLMNGEILVRGIELRRHDAPSFIKEFQSNLIKILLNAEDSKQIYSETMRKAISYVVETYDRISSGEINLKELVVSKVLRKRLNDYSRMFPHVSAGLQLHSHGKTLKKGEVIDFVYINSEHPNPLRRVVAYQLYDENYYDKDKYAELVLDAAESVLAPFEFNRRQLGERPKPRSFFEQLHEEQMREILLELETVEEEF